MVPWKNRSNFSGERSGFDWEGSLILILMLQETSAFNACFALARALMGSGKQVAFITGSDFQGYVATHGFQTIHCEPAQPQPKSPLPSPIAEAEEFKRLDQIIREEKPEALLLDQILWYKAPPFLRAGVPIMGLNTTLAHKFHSKTPPIFSSRPISWSPSFWVRFGNTLSWMSLWLLKWSTAYNKSVWMLLKPVQGRRIWLDRRKAVKAAGGTIGWGEYGFRLQIPELVLGPGVFNEPNFQDRVYCGACVDANRMDGLDPWTGEPHHVSQPDSRPLVYASLGSYGHYHPHRLAFFEKLVEVFRQRPHLRLLIQLRDGAQVIANCPENVVISSWLPQLEILSKAALFLTHAGFGSCREALWFGTPMIAFPFFNDQFGNTARILHHGLGVSSNIETADILTLGNQIDHILTNPQYAQRAENFRHRIQQEGVCSQGLDYVLTWLKQENS